MAEREFARKEASACEAEDAYFEARPQIDCPDHRRIFAAAFSRGWDVASPSYPLGLSDSQINNIAESMPGGIDGFLKKWGWRQFARAIEEAHDILFSLDEEQSNTATPAPA